MPWVAHFKTGVASMAFSCLMRSAIGTYIACIWVKAEAERHRQSVRYINDNKHKAHRAARQREGEKKIIRR